MPSGMLAAPIRLWAVYQTVILRQKPSPKGCTIGWFAPIHRRRDNVLAVLEEVNWKIEGADGVAELLGVKPTTMRARMKRWGLKKPKTP